MICMVEGGNVKEHVLNMISLTKRFGSLDFIININLQIDLILQSFLKSIS